MLGLGDDFIHQVFKLNSCPLLHVYYMADLVNETCQSSCFFLALLLGHQIIALQQVVSLNLVLHLDSSQVLGRNAVLFVLDNGFLRRVFETLI